MNISGENAFKTGRYDRKTSLLRQRGFSACRKASQSFAPAGAKEIEIMFPGGVYVGKHTLRPASVQAVRLRRTARARSRPRPVVEKLQRSFSTASKTSLLRQRGFCSVHIAGDVLRSPGGIAGDGDGERHAVFSGKDAAPVEEVLSFLRVLALGDLVEVVDEDV